MGLYNVLNRALMQQGQPEDISEVVANFDALATILNGQIDPANMRGAPALATGETYVWDGIQHVRSSATKLNASQLTDLANHSAPAQINAANTDMVLPNTYAPVVDLMPDVAGTTNNLRSLGSGKFNGQRVVIRHTGAGGTRFTVSNNLAGAAAGFDKFFTRDNTDLVLMPLDTIEFVYLSGVGWIEVNRDNAIAPTHLWGGVHSNAVLALPANQAYLIPIPDVVRATTLTRLAYYVGGVSGNMDLGIYFSDDEATFTRLFSQGSFVVGGPGIQYKTIAVQTINPVPGRRWYYALAVDNAVASYYGVNPGSANSFVPGAYLKAASFPLPSSLAGMTGITNQPVPSVHGLA